jgi:hypothetical protein
LDCQSDLGVCLREVSLSDAIGFVVDFEAILSPKVAPVRQRVGQNNAW